MTTSLLLKRDCNQGAALADLRRPESEEGQRQIAETALATATADLQTANDNSLLLKVRLQPRSRRLRSPSRPESKKGNVKLQKPLATATADLQTANDNFSAAQSEIAIKSRRLLISKPTWSRRRATSNCRNRSSNCNR